MPPAFEVLLLNTAIPQIQAAQSGDTYVVPRDIAFSAALTLSAGTANGVPYLNASKVLTTGSALTFDGSNLGLGQVPAVRKFEINAIPASISQLNGIRMQMDGVATSASEFLLGTDSGGVPYTSIRTGNDGNSYMNFLVGSGPTERMRISSDGTFRVKGAGTAGSTDAVQFSGSAPASAMTLDASGNLGVGATSPSNGVEVAVGSKATAGILVTGNNSPRIVITETGGTVTGGILADTAAIYLGTSTNHPTVLRTNGTERARITSDGKLLAGTVDASPGYGNTNNGAQISASGSMFSRAATDYVVSVNQNTSDGGTYYQIIFRQNNSPVGSITSTVSATAYNTSSDYRLKDNPQPLTGSGAFIDALKPKTWDWKSGGKGVGFIAHEVQEVSLGSVVGTKDAVDKEGKPIMQAMEYGSAEFIANIIAELQSLRARVAQLEQGA